jgi:hypothetical protein
MERTRSQPPQLSAEETHQVLRRAAQRRLRSLRQAVERFLDKLGGEAGP